MKTLPKFTLTAYKELLQAFISRGARFRQVCDIADSEAGDLFLRHDLDFSLELALPMAFVESELKIYSTYYILLSGPYNPCSRASVSAMREILRLGHDVGLHYDLSQYPEEAAAASRRLTLETRFLAELSGKEIKTIVMHEPSRGHQDLFEGCRDWINPTFYQKNDSRLMYVSDSCRAWRDQSLLSYLNSRSEQDRLLLNIHPESWLAERGQHRLTYLEETLLPLVMEPVRSYFLGPVKFAWQNHVGPVSGYGDDDE